MSYSPDLYMHDLDRRAFDALNAFPKLVKLKETYLANFNEKTAKINFLSNAIRLSENQMPELYEPLLEVSEKLDIEVPELYYVKSKTINAATGGSTMPYIYVTSELVKKIPKELISSVLAHECGHIACGHYLYHSIAVQLINGIASSPITEIPGVSRYLTPTLVRALLFWDRCSELSADRAAVLCDGDANKTIDVLLKVHGYDKNINREEFIKQAIDLHNFVNESNSNKFIEKMLIKDEDHPRMATRVYECYEWWKSSQLRVLLTAHIHSEIERMKKKQRRLKSFQLAFHLTLIKNQT